MWKTYWHCQEGLELDFHSFFFSTTKTRREWEETQHTQKGGAPSHLRPVLVGQPQCLDQLWIQVPKNWWGLQQSLKKFMQERCTETTSVLGNPCAKKGWKLEKYPELLPWGQTLPHPSPLELGWSVFWWLWPCWFVVLQPSTFGLWGHKIALVVPSLPPLPPDIWCVGLEPCQPLTLCMAHLAWGKQKQGVCSEKIILEGRQFLFMTSVHHISNNSLYSCSGVVLFLWKDEM